MGEQILIPVKGLYYTQLTGMPSLVSFLTQNIGVTMLTYLFIKFYAQKEGDNY